MPHRLASLAALIVLFASSPRPSAALEVTPYAGALIPTRSMLSGEFRMNSHSVFGLSLGTPVSDRLSVELSVAAGAGTFEFGRDQKSRLLLGDLRGRWGIRGNEDASLGVVVGAGYTEFNVVFFEALETVGRGGMVGRLTGIAGLDVRSRLTDHMHLTISALDRIHDQGASYFNRDGPENLQHDFMFTAGLRFPLD